MAIPQFLTVAETAKIFRMSPRRVAELVQAGVLKGGKPFGKWLIDSTCVTKKLKELGVKAEEL